MSDRPIPATVGMAWDIFTRSTELLTVVEFKVMERKGTDMCLIYLHLINDDDVHEYYIVWVEQDLPHSHGKCYFKKGFIYEKEKVLLTRQSRRKE